jgi:hypothetical protein
MANQIVTIVRNGLLAGTAYLGAQAIDRKITGNRLDDTVLLGALAPLPDSFVRPAGVVMHFGNSVVASAAYELVARDRLTGPGWWRGAVFIMIENLALYPLALLERHHPAIRSGKLDSYRTWTAFAQQVWRHLAFGITLGTLPSSRTNHDHL